MYKLITTIVLCSNGMMLQAQTQTKIIKTAHRFYFNADYLVSTNTKNTNRTKPLFAGSGINFGIGHIYEMSKYFGIVTRANYSSGKVNKDGINSFAKTFASKTTNTIANNGWSQIQLTTGIGVRPTKKVPFFFEIAGGIGINPNTNSLLISEGAGGLIYYEAKEKGTIPVWNVNTFYMLTKANSKKHLHLRTSYGSNGFSIGLMVAIAEHCCVSACPCAKACPCGSSISTPEN